MNGTAPVPVAIVFAGSRAGRAGAARPAARRRRRDRGRLRACASRPRSACTCDHLVGDLDSADPSAVDAAVASGTDRRPASGREGRDRSRARVRRRDRARRAPRSCSSTAAATGSIICSATCCCSRRRRCAGVEVEAFSGTARIAGGARRRSAGRRSADAPGSLVTLLPSAARRAASSTEGLRYPLRDEELAPGTTRGVSNELVARLRLGPARRRARCSSCSRSAGCRNEAAARCAVALRSRVVVAVVAAACGSSGGKPGDDPRQEARRRRSCS